MRFENSKRACKEQAAGTPEMRIIAFILIFLLLFVVSVILFHNQIIKFALVKATEGLTGFSVAIENLNLGLRDNIVEAGGMKVYNPKEFEDRLFLDVPSLFVRYDLPKVLKGEYYMDEFSLYIREFQVIRNADGSSNIGRMKNSIIALRPKGEGPAKLPNIKVKTLKLKVDKVVLKDYSFRPPAIRIYDVKVEKKFDNVDDPKELVRLIIVQSLLRSGVKDLADVDIAGLTDSVSSILRTGTDVVFGTLNEAGDIVKKTLGVFKGIFAPQNAQTQNRLK